MPGTTPVYGFPYPEPTDLVADYPALGQQLAEDVEDVLPTIGGLAPVAPTSIANSGGSASTTGNTTTFSGVSSISLNGVFSADYDNYRIVLQITNGSASDVEISLRMRASGSDNSTSNYRYGFLGGRTSDGNVSCAAGNGVTQFLLGKTPSGGGNPRLAAGLDFFAPQISSITGLVGSSFRMANGTEFFGSAGGGIFDATTQFDGFSLFPASGTITGSVSVYGYRK
jgi:hypothetical protein